MAETRHKIKRKLGAKDEDDILAETTISPERDHESYRGRRLAFLPDSVPESFRSISTIASNTWQIYPGRLWWDSAMSSLTRSSELHRNDTRLLMLYLEVCHKLSHGLYRLQTSKDRSWALDRLTGDTALRFTALSISACFEASLSQPPRSQDIGICPRVRQYQTSAMRDLQSRIDAFSIQGANSPKDYICDGLGLLGIVHNLTNLEVFSQLHGSGTWQVHHKASRTLLNHLETFSVPGHGGLLDTIPSRIEYVLSVLPESEQKRSLQFSLSEFIWLDIIATATFGLASYSYLAFDYLPLLRREIIKPQEIMGCEKWIIITIIEITRLQSWLSMPNTPTGLSFEVDEIRAQSNPIAERLAQGIDGLERLGYEAQSTPSTILGDFKEDSRLVSILWAQAAQLFLQATVQRSPPGSDFHDQTLVATTLAKLEALPARLVMHVHWPYTIAGCMAAEALRERFRCIVPNVMQQCQAPGVTWKGLMVMEECWKLRRSRSRHDFGWTEAMDCLGGPVLLI